MERLKELEKIYDSTFRFEKVYDSTFRDNGSTLMEELYWGGHDKDMLNAMRYDDDIKQDIINSKDVLKESDNVYAREIMIEKFIEKYDIFVQKIKLI